jgi:hypothetical protein
VRAGVGVCFSATLGIAGAATAVADTTFVVNRTGDAADLNLANAACDVSSNAGNQCTLRAAIEEANDTPGADTINFNIAGSALRKVIAPGSPLPAVTEQLTINGYSQQGASPNTLANGENADLRIVLDGINLAGARGLSIEADDCVVRGLVIQRFGTVGVAVFGTGNVIAGNFIGTNAVGEVARGNGEGVSIFDDDNRVGGTAPGDRNVISGNDGYGIEVDAVHRTLIQGNFIGTTSQGTAALGNRFEGIHIEDSADTTVGGAVAGARNVISGNDDHGISVEGDHDGVTVIQGNYIGTNAAGTAALGNAGAGIFATARDILVGGTSSVARNIVSGNDGPGMHLDLNSAVALIQGNFVGTNAAGNGDIGNAGPGLRILGTDTQVGGTAAGAGNVISGNGSHGIDIGLDGADAVIQRNRIGTAADGTLMGNDGDGIHAVSASGLTIGGAAPGAANQISGNGGDGIELAMGATGATIQANSITDNDVNGVLVGAGSQTISGNLITENGRHGVQVAAKVTGVRIFGNHMQANSGLGINLVGGNENSRLVTANDLDDPDQGANNLQNFPVLTGANRNAAGTTTVRGALNSTPSVTFRIDLYLAAPDVSGHGEGVGVAATFNLTTNSGGDGQFQVQLNGLGPGQVLTATATRLSTNDTSEFSANRAVVQV